MPSDSNEYVLCRTDSVCQALKGKHKQLAITEKLMELVKLLEKGEGGSPFTPSLTLLFPSHGHLRIQSLSGAPLKGYSLDRVIFASLQKNLKALSTM